MDTHSEKEAKRWVFPTICTGLYEVARDVSSPRHYLKLCDTSATLRSALPAKWQIQPENYFMEAGDAVDEIGSLRDGYRVESQLDLPSTDA